MKSHRVSLGAIGLFVAVLQASAATLFVDLNSANPQPPYSDWSTAAANIQDAIDAATAGDTVMVTNGIYAVGGATMAQLDYGTGSNRVAVDKAITVESVNGPWATIIQGSLVSPYARCVWLTNGASLTGFTLSSGEGAAGGGVWCASSNAMVADCVIIANRATYYGDGAYQGTLINCLISSNGVNGSGQGACDSVLRNCTVIKNSGIGICQTSGHKAYATNCIIYFNSGLNYWGGVYSYCCMTPATGIGNFTNDPQLFVDGVHLTSTSPCIGAGMSVATGTDIFGNPWANPPSVGCAEEAGAPLVAQPQIQLTGAPVGFTVGGPLITGQTPFACRWIKDGSPLADNGHFSFTQSANLVATGVGFTDAGNYQLVVGNAFGVVTSAVAQLVVHCVDIGSANPVAPYSTWETAATNIQDAITASVAGDVVLVTSGFYTVGGKSMDGVLTNRVSVDKAILVQGVMGTGAPMIQGAWDPVSTNGAGAVRCVWLTNNAILSGFELCYGATRSDLADYEQYTPLIGGGAYGLSNSIIANCTINNNAAAIAGGGAVGATLINCLLTDNSVLGIPGYGISTAGGGASGCNLENCTVTDNYSLYEGGGTYSGLLKNCAIVGNSAVQEAGGAYYGTLINCTITGNRVLSATYNYGGGVSFATLTNCIVYGNQQAYSGTASNYYNCTFSFSCSSPLPDGSGNIGADPQLLPDGIHLIATSPCVGAGTASVVSGTDVDGQPWPNPPSMGCADVFVGPLSVNLLASQTNLLVSSPFSLFPHITSFQGIVTGRVAYVTWSFGDGSAITNLGASTSHYWTNCGLYTVAFTAFNNDNPAGVSTNLVVQVSQPVAPQMQSSALMTNGFQFEFAGQSNAYYTIQYTTNLAPPVVWQDLPMLYFDSSLIQVNDTTAANTARFYRVLAQ